MSRLPTQSSLPWSFGQTMRAVQKGPNSLRYDCSQCDQLRCLRRPWAARPQGSLWWPWWSLWESFEEYPTLSCWEPSSCSGLSQPQLQCLYLWQWRDSVHLICIASKVAGFTGSYCFACEAQMLPKSHWITLSSSSTSRCVKWLRFAGATYRKIEWMSKSCVSRDDATWHGIDKVELSFVYLQVLLGRL